MSGENSKNRSSKNLNECCPVENLSVKKIFVLIQFTLMCFFLIGCKGEDADKIPTITMELLERGDDSFDTFPVSWCLVADPVPDKDLVVIIGKYNRQIGWQDWDLVDRSLFDDGVRNKEEPPFYVVIGKSNRHSQTFKASHSLTNPFFDFFPIYINPLPSVSVVGKSIHIDTETLDQTLPATTHAGHIVPKGHKFVQYQVGNSYGIDKEVNVITK